MNDAYIAIILVVAGIVLVMSFLRYKARTSENACCRCCEQQAWTLKLPCTVAPKPSSVKSAAVAGNVSPKDCANGGLPAR